MQKGNPKNWTPNEASVHLYNPLPEDITFDFYEDTKEPERVVIGAQSIVTFPEYKAAIALNRILTAIVNHRKIGYVTPEILESIRKEVTELEELNG